MTNRRKTFRPDWAVMPGETISETLDEMGLTGLVAADRMGIAPTELSEIINGKRSITALQALRLEGLTGVTADLWLRLQGAYDLQMARLGILAALRRGGSPGGSPTDD